MTTFTFAPTVPDRQALRAAAAASVNYTPAPFSLLDAPDAPEYTLDGSDAADIGITPRCIVRILSSPVDCPLFVRVVKVLSDDTLYVADLTVPAVQWRVAVSDVALALCAQAAAHEDAAEAS